MSFYNTGKYQIFYEVIRNSVSAPTVFLHGNLASGKWFKPMLNEWTGPKTHNALLIDWRGCGLSDGPTEERDMHPDQLTQDILAVLDEVKMDKCNIVGHSTGALLALTTAAAQPARFKKVMALDPVGATGIKFDPALEGAFVQMANNKELAGQIVASTIYQFDMNSEFYREVIREDAFIAAKKIGLWLLKNLDTIDYRDAFKNIKAQTLLMHGEHDVLLPVAETQKLQEIIPGATFEVVKGHGHCTNVEDAKWFANRVNAFLN